jgi:Uma2 family endonuclease
MGEPAKSLVFPWNDEDRPWPAQGQWTYADYARLPDDGHRYEVIRGHLYVTPPPIFFHQHVVTELSRLLGNFVVEGALGRVFVAPVEIVLPNRIATPIQPDVVFFRTGNQPRLKDQKFHGVPDLVVEVESPRTRNRDWTTKREAYLEAGVPEYWLASSRTCTVTVLTLSEDRTRYVELGCFGLGDTIRSVALPGLAIPVDPLFPPE